MLPEFSVSFPGFDCVYHKLPLRQLRMLGDNTHGYIVATR